MMIYLVASSAGGTTQVWLYSSSIVRILEREKKGRVKKKVWSLVSDLFRMMWNGWMMGIEIE
jgi:hypothetical protein